VAVVLEAFAMLVLGHFCTALLLDRAHVGYLLGLRLINKALTTLALKPTRRSEKFQTFFNVPHSGGLRPVKNKDTLLPINHPARVFCDAKNDDDHLAPDSRTKNIKKKREGRQDEKQNSPPRASAESAKD